MFHCADLKAFYPYQLSINQSALRPRRSGDVFLFIYIFPGQCPTIRSSSPAAIRFRWRVEGGGDIALPAARDTQSIAMSTTRKLVLSLPRWLLLRSPIIHHVRWSPSNLKLSIMKHERDIMTQCGQVLVCCICCRWLMSICSNMF